LPIPHDTGGGDENGKSHGDGDTQNGKNQTSDSHAAALLVRIGFDLRQGDGGADDPGEVPGKSVAAAGEEKR